MPTTDAELIDQAVTYCEYANREILRLRKLLQRIRNHAETTMQLMDDDAGKAAHIAALHLGIVAGLASHGEHPPHVTPPAVPAHRKEVAGDESRGLSKPTDTQPGRQGGV